MAWNDPNHDVLADIAAMRSQAKLEPTRLVISPWTYVELVLCRMDLGRWPLRPVRRAVMRWALKRYLTATYPAE